ncbi:1-phosphofructokinase family hexose kinase [Ramlibacter pallidus]|uniref:Phosphofructokinase n=1 Tax=Ramlibacter pallidus TaxID=2780087 RepID=A0ABR9RXP4_9BURK|nr:1-phosphofructokinase family hexose kinase [Ramlibacter pallidus]MBE7366012.1 1-phosphofructokinase family hexose kinase [Ramlibacter pallidus]
MSASPRILTLTLNPAVDLSTRTAKVEPAHKMRCDAARVHPGGGGINVARVIARLGGSVNALYPAGGPTGERLRALLHDEHVPNEALTIAGETRESFSVVEEASGREYRFVLPGPALSPAEWQDCLDRTAAAARGCAFVVASGSLPPGVPQDAYGQLARRLAPMDVRLVLDTSGAALAGGLEARVHLFKPSLRELQELTGAALAGTRERIAACRAVIDRGQAKVVALSLGAGGALLVAAGEAWQAPALHVAVASTIGAGDSFLGALVLGMARGEPLERAFRSAMAASAAALLNAGTALCSPGDLDRLLPQVQVARVDATAI